VSTKAHLGIRQYLSLFSREDMKSLNLVSEIREESRGVLPDIIRKRAAKSSSSQDLDDITAGCHLGFVQKNMKNTYTWNFLRIITSNVRQKINRINFARQVYPKYTFRTMKHFRWLF
jgi:hypothetical protein